MLHRASRWFTQCKEFHDQCTAVQSGTTLLPTRVLDISTTVGGLPAPLIINSSKARVRGSICSIELLLGRYSDSALEGRLFTQVHLSSSDISRFATNLPGRNLINAIFGAEISLDRCAVYYSRFQKRLGRTISSDVRYLFRNKSCHPRGKWAKSSTRPAEYL